jgi:hypothetical protein
MQRQYLQRQCDHCGRTARIPLGNLHPNDEAEISAWIMLGKEHFLASGEQPQQLARHACSGTCAVEIIRNGMLEVTPIATT